MTNPEVTQTITERLLPDVIHKIKNSLGGIGGFAALLERDLEPGCGSRRLVLRIEEGVQKINNLAVDLMILVRDLDYNPDSINLRDFIHSLQDSAEPGESLYCLRKVRNIPESVTITGDANLLQKLINYALRYISLIGRVEQIRINSESGSVNLEIIAEDGNMEETNHSTSDFLHNTDPIEARLCLANTMKLSDMHNGFCEILVRKGKRNLTIGL